MKFIFIFLYLLTYIIGASQPVGNIYKEIETVDIEIKNNPNDENLYNKRALLFLEIKEYEKSLEDVEIALSINPKNSALYYTQTLIYYRKKRFDSALESANKMVSLSPTEPNLYLRSTIYYSRGEIREAILDLNRILKLNTGADYIYLQKAIWCNDLNMYYEEIKNYIYYTKISKDYINVEQVKKRLKKIKKSDKYYRDLYKAAKKDIKINGYPWNYKVWE